MTKESDSIEEQAAQWLIRIDAGGSPDQWRKLDAWLAKSPRHRAEFLRLSTAWLRADQLRALRPLEGGIDLNVLIQSVQRARNAHKVRRPRWLQPQWAFGALAATLAAAVIGVGVWRALPYFDSRTYATQVGDVAHVVLNDGSRVDLNTDTRLHISYTPWRRKISLDKGEALFNVAQQRTRPFEVVAGATTVRALGTEFSVRLRDASHVDVRVTEGRVSLNPPSTEVLGPGDTVAIADNLTVGRKVPVELLNKQQGWIEGRLFFSGETLSEAVAEFNRYNRRQLAIVDPRIATLSVSGTFVATEPERFVTALAPAFGVRALPAQHDEDRTIRLSGP